MTVTFAIYRQQDGGAPVWLETQNVTPDSSGHYSVLLGNTRAEGIPADLFGAKEEQWLGVQVQGEAEQPRVLLVSVPYAMKAADAETVGGLPPSAFLRATPLQSIAIDQVTSSSNAGSLSPALGGTGTTGFLPIWSNSTPAYASKAQTQPVQESTPPLSAATVISTSTPSAMWAGASVSRKTDR